MRVSKQYVEELLQSPDAIDAINQLSQLWSPRLSEKAPNFGLSEVEYMCQLCLIFFGEVGNGGLSQYFRNRGFRQVPDTLRALREIGCIEEEAALRSAYGMIAPSFDRDSGRIDETVLRQFENFNRIIMRERPDNRLLGYLRAHRDQVLQPEQG